jgi:glutamyl endopeptidase
MISLTRLFSAFAASAFLAFTLPAAAQVTHLDESVSDDGSRAPSSREAARNYSPSSRGVRGELHLSLTKLRAAGMRPAPEDFRERARKARSPLTGKLLTPQSVIGGPSESVIDDDGRTRVTNTKTFPARATVLILFEGGFGCSGWLVNRDTVVTAGHCVSPGDGTMYARSTYEIAPGYNDTAADPTPYGMCGARRLYTNATFKNNGTDTADDFDYGAIKLDCIVPAEVGHYGYRRNVADDDRITVQGYPGDKPFGTQWRMSGRVTVLQPRRVFYRIDTAGGQSGSPVWRNVNSNCEFCGIGIHAYGVDGTDAGLYGRHNHGTRITDSVFQNITNWKNAP